MKASTEHSQTLNGHAQYEPCEECGAPLDPQQRYCVNCAARRGNGANPSSRYFATMSQRARRPSVRPSAVKTSSGSRAAAVAFFALLPIAVAIGVVVGRSGNDSGENEALLEALRNRPAAVASTTTGAASATANSAKGGKAKAAAKAGKGAGKALAKTSNGTVHEVGTGYKPPAKKVEEDTKLVEANPEQAGENYIKAQQNLPDVTVVGGDPSEAPAAAGGAGEP
jgi:predicted hydrocarbon binding protein